MTDRKYKRPLPLCKPGYFCLACPYDDCIRPSWAESRTKEEGDMLAKSGMMGIWISIGMRIAYERKKKSQALQHLAHQKNL